MSMAPISMRLGITPASWGAESAQIGELHRSRYLGYPLILTLDLGPSCEAPRPLGPGASALRGSVRFSRRAWND